MRRLRAFGRFWWDFVVGDDWRVAAGVAVALVLTEALARRSDDVWWLLPLAVAIVLAASVRRATRRDDRAG
jgi:hypothetical protein